MDKKTYVTDKHYTFNEITRKITFIKEERLYKIEKKVFASHGVDIDKIRTVNQYDSIRMLYSQEVLAVMAEKWVNFKPRTLEEKQRKYLMTNDLEGFRRLSKLIEKKNAIQLKIIK